MKIIILAGGKGSRLTPFTDHLAKPMLPIGGNPFLWHLTQFFEGQGFGEIGLALGHFGEQIAHFFPQYYCLDTGIETPTGGRLLPFRDWIGNESFILTYGDGLCDVDIRDLIDFHSSHGRIATLTAVNPTSSYGELSLEENQVKAFREKPRLWDRWINGGFFVLEPAIFSYLADETIFEKSLEHLSLEGELMAYRHSGFWEAMDYPSDYQKLMRLWESGHAPWAHNVLQQ